MAQFTVNYMSAALKRTTTLTVLLPTDKLDSEKRYTGLGKQEYKTIYLLHGLLGSHMDWINGTRIQMWAQEKNLAVVMPSGDNSFYIDQPASNADYGEFIGQELVEMTRAMFPLSNRREDTFIGGLSMGGFGAMRNGIKYADTFSHIITLSAALSIFETSVEREGRVSFDEDRAFGGIENVRHTDKNPRYAALELVERIQKDPSVSFPKIYMTCGKQDGLFEANQIFCQFLDQQGFDVTWEEEDGIHDWYFWDKKIRAALDWLPLETSGQGVNSGNIFG